MIRSMDWKEVYLRFGGVVLAIFGMVMIILSGEMVSGFGLNISEKLAEFMLRAGFGTLLVGLLAIFLFSFKTVPLELSTSFLRTQGRNVGRLLDSLNLEGNGIYVPKGGRLTEDRVYIPLEKNPMPLPDLARETVFNVGTTGPSLGVSLLPLGLDLVDRVEKDSGMSFREDTLADGEEALERLGKGTGIYKGIKMRIKGDTVELGISHGRLKETCDAIWDEHPKMHSKIGCPGCSAVLCATARIMKSPLRIREVENTGISVNYILERR